MEEGACLDDVTWGTLVDFNEFLVSSTKFEMIIQDENDSKLILDEIDVFLHKIYLASTSQNQPILRYDVINQEFGQNWVKYQNTPQNIV